LYSEKLFFVMRSGSVGWTFLLYEVEYIKNDY